jgi:hypothetical protein
MHERTTVSIGRLIPVTGSQKRLLCLAVIMYGHRALAQFVRVRLSLLIEFVSVHMNGSMAVFVIPKPQTCLAGRPAADPQH